MATKENPGNFDCYANAEPDEPLFVLLGRDKHAPALVWLWCVLRELDQEDPAKVAEARECALQMIAWAKAKGRKSVGVGQSALAAVLELIRAANHGIALSQKAENQRSDDVDVVRGFFCRTEFAASKQ